MRTGRAIRTEYVNRVAGARRECPARVPRA
jgi:hypothetical protein